MLISICKGRPYSHAESIGGKQIVIPLKYDAEGLQDSLSAKPTYGASQGPVSKKSLQGYFKVAIDQV